MENSRRNGLFKESSDYEIISADTVYVGNIDGDDYDTAEFDIRIKGRAKEVPLGVTISFKDEYNQVFTKDMTLTLRVYSAQELKTLSGGAQNFGVTVISIMVMVLLLVLWLFMFIELLRTPMTRYKKVLWVVLFLGTFILGAIVFYFMGRRKSR